jgi:hypothetical protein
LGDGRLGDYLLPAPSVEGESKRAIRTSLRFLKVAVQKITVPLLGAVYRAPLGEMVPLDLSVYLVGQSGEYKTELTAIAQAHYGSAFNGRYLPANWEHTENALEKLAFGAKDAIIVVDDFAPAGTASDVGRLHRKADRVLRAQGNRSGRGRMRADTTLRVEHYPRGLVVSSGEDVPRGRSLKARVMIGEVSPGAVNLDVLSELQRAAVEGVLASATSGHIKWLASRVDELKERLPRRQRELRDLAIGAGTHARTPDIVASLFLGLEVFLEFALQEGAISYSQAEELLDTAWKALGEAAAAISSAAAVSGPTPSSATSSGATSSASRSIWASSSAISSESVQWRRATERMANLVAAVGLVGFASHRKREAFSASRLVASPRRASLSRPGRWRATRGAGWPPASWPSRPIAVRGAGRVATPPPRRRPSARPKPRPRRSPGP